MPEAPIRPSSGLVEPTLLKTDDLAQGMARALLADALAMPQDRDRGIFHDVIDHVLRTARDNQVDQLMQMDELHDAVAAGVSQ